MTIIFSLLMTISSCKNFSGNTTYNDTTKPSIKSGFYLATNDTTDIVIRKLNSITKSDVFNGKQFILSLKNYLPFDIVDSAYWGYSKNPKSKYYDIYFHFTPQGLQEFNELTNKSSDPKFISDNGYARLGIILNNTLIQVGSIMGPFSSNTVTLMGVFDEATAQDLIKEMQKEMQQKKS